MQFLNLANRWGKKFNDQTLKIQSNFGYRSTGRRVGTTLDINEDLIPPQRSLRESIKPIKLIRFVSSSTNSKASPAEIILNLKLIANFA